MNVRHLVAAVAAATACHAVVAQSDLPEPVRVPAGHTMAMKAMGVGEITYECRAKTGDPAAFEWVFVAPVAKLMDASNKEVGKYYAGPTWEAADGSKVAGHTVASVDSSDPNAIAHLLLKADSHAGFGVLAGVKSVQRLQTSGGRAPKEACAAKDIGRQARVPYTATYYFYAEGPASGY